MLISSLSPIWWYAYISLFLKVTTPLYSTHSTYLFKIFFSLLTLSTAFLQKACGPGKNSNMEKMDRSEVSPDICLFYNFWKE